MELEKKLLDVYLTECRHHRPDKSKHYNGLSPAALARLNDLSQLAYQEFLDAATKQVSKQIDGQVVMIEFDFPTMESTIYRYWSQDKEGDDLTLLLIHDAPRLVIKQVTGAHVTTIRMRRQLLGLADIHPRGRHRILEPDELRKIVAVWRDLHNCRVALRLVATHNMVGLSIAHVWEGLQEMNEPIDTPTPMAAVS